MFTKPSSGSDGTGRVLVGTVDQSVFVQVEGRGTHVNSQPLRECLIQMVQRGYRSFQLDLGDCTYMDSTFLGVLAHVCLQLRSRLGTFTIPRITDRNLELLQTMGIDRFFEFGCNASEEPCNFTQLPTDQRSKQEWGQTVLDAHRTLVDVDPRNAPRFKDVIRFLEEDLKKDATVAGTEELSSRRDR
jgi:anti-sigma B factor antagonist